MPPDAVHEYVSQSAKTPLLPIRPEQRRTTTIVKTTIGLLTSGAVAAGASLGAEIGWKGLLEAGMKYGFGPVIAALLIWWLLSVYVPRQEQLLTQERERGDQRVAERERLCEEERKKDREANQMIYDKMIARIERVDDGLGDLSQEVRKLGETFTRESSRTRKTTGVIPIKGG